MLAARLAHIASLVVVHEVAHQLRSAEVTSEAFRVVATTVHLGDLAYDELPARAASRGTRCTKPAASRSQGEDRQSIISRINLWYFIKKSLLRYHPSASSLAAVP